MLLCFQAGREDGDLELNTEESEECSVVASFVLRTSSGMMLCLSEYVLAWFEHI